MKQIRQVLSLSITLMALIAAVAVARAAAGPSSDSPLTGTWMCEAHGGSLGDMNFTLDLQQNGQEVTGSVSSPLGETNLASATFKNHKLRIQIEGQDTKYTLIATYANGKLAGEWHKSNGDKGTWRGEKSRQ